MQYLLCYFFLLMPFFESGMETVRENKLTLSMARNDTRAYYRFSVLNFTKLKHKHIVAQKLEFIDIEPFFLAERLTQSLPTVPIPLKKYCVLKNVITNQGFIKIEDVMSPKNLVILYIKQKCVYQPNKVYSLVIELYNPQMNLLRTISYSKNEPLQSDKLTTYLNVTLNSENLNEIEIEATPSH